MMAKIHCRGKRIEIPKKTIEKKEEIDYALEMEEIKISAKGTSFEELIKKQKDTSPYQRMFLVNAEITSRTGKMANIRKKHHERITKIIQVIGNNEITIFSYIDNVLKHHFDTYQDEITELYNKNNKEIF